MDDKQLNPYEDLLCAECSYSVDNTGLCVMDADHKALGLCKRCEGELTSADYEAGACTQCNNRLK